jgi:hypothetical protein
MAISFIPNQPILFEDPLFAGQSCLNNDTRQYAQLAQSGDSMCIQFINEPIATLYSCDMTVFSDVVNNGTFDSNLSAWDEYNFATGTNLGAPTNWTWTPDGATSNPTATQIGLVQNIPGTVGAMFLISFEFSYDNGGDFKIGFGNASSNSWNFVNLLNNFETNIDGRRCLLVSSYIALDFAFYCTTSNVTIKNLVIRDVTTGQCVVPNSSVNAHWTYVESVNGWQKIDGTVATAYPLAIFNSMVSGTYYRLRYKVMNMPEDSIAYMEIQDNSNATLAKTFVNGEFAEYFNYTGPSAQPYILANPEAQNGVIYDIAFEEMCYNHRISVTNTDNSPASIWYDSSSPLYKIQYYKDRIVWCFTWSGLTSADVPGAPLNSACYTITFDDQCSGGVTTQSYTIVNYKATGSHPCSVLVQGNNQGYAFGFFFNDPDTSVEFILLQRLRILQFNPMYPTKTEQYLYSNGDMFRSFAQTGKVRSAWFDYVDEPTHDVIRLQLLSDTLTIDSTEFFCIAEDYEPEWGENGKYNLAQSKVTLMAVNEPTLYNKNCL